MEAHRKLTAAGGLLLAATLLLHYGGWDAPPLEYVTGVGMLACLGAALVIFTKDRL